MSEELPPMTGEPAMFNFDKKKVEEVKPAKRAVSKVHERSEGTSDAKKKFICEGLDAKCTFPGTDFKSAYVNHIKTHKPDVLELYSGDIVQLWQPFGAGELVWDAEKNIYVSPNHIVIPKGFKLHKLTGKVISKTVPTRTHDGGIRSMDFMEVIVKREGLKE